jgi:hypothetical protein
MSPTDVSPLAPGVTQRIRARHQPLLGGLLVKEGLINQAQLERVLTLQVELEPRPLLGQLLVDEKLITPHELNAALTKYNREHLLGDVLVETNVITPAQLETALAMQRKTKGPLGETLVELGFITERQLKHALSIQLRIAFVDLDDRPIDPELTSLVSESYARHHQLMPIARSDDRIVLAMADPTDVERVSELRACTRHEIDVVTATSDAVERALSRAYGSRAPAPSPGEPAKPEAALIAVRARMEGIRQVARTWERWADSVETLLRERPERRAEIVRLTAELEESRVAHARASRELEAKADALTALEAAYAALAQERDALRGSLRELQERHDALLRDRRFAIDRLEAALQRLRS